MQKYNSRAEVPDKYKWDLTDFFKNETEFNKTYEDLKEKIKKLEDYIGCTKDKEKLYEYLKLELDVVATWEDLYVYSYLVNDQELNNPESIERKSKCELLNLDIEKSTSFFAPELLKLSKEEYNDLFKDNSKLLEFKDALDRIYRNKDHILSENEEKIISSLTNSVDHFEDISSTMLNSLHDYGNIKIDNDDITIATNNYHHLMKNKDREVRKEVRSKFNNKISEYSSVNASLLSSYVSMNEAVAKIRGFDSSWDSKMFNWNFNTKVFRTLVDTVNSNLDKLQKYYELKRKILKLDKLTPVDLALDISNLDKEYSIEEARQMTTSVISVLGKEYKEKFEKIFDNKYIDFCQYKGKCSGGYSFSTINQNSRILMSYNGNLESISTIIHEGGHNVHHQFVKENNPPQYRNTSSIVAEVASLTNECLLSNYLAKEGKTKEERLSGIANILDVITSNLFGAVREGQIEEEMYNKIHNGEVLTKKYLDNLSAESLKRYYGDKVECDDLIKNGWVTRSHYYMNFYLYSYAISICVATTIAKKILSNDKNMIEKYIDFLKTGSNLWPIDIYKKLNIDLEKPEVYENACQYFSDLIDEYIKIYEE